LSHIQPGVPSDAQLARSSPGIARAPPRRRGVGRGRACVNLFCARFPHTTPTTCNARTYIPTHAARHTCTWKRSIQLSVRDPSGLRSGIVIRVGYCTVRIYVYIYIYKTVANSIKCNDDTHREHSHTIARRRGRESLLMIGPTTAAGHDNSNSNGKSDDENIDTPCGGSSESAADKRFGAGTKRGDRSAGRRTATPPRIRSRLRVRSNPVRLKSFT